MTATSGEQWSPGDHAEAYAALGWHVFPITPGTKKPSVRWGEGSTDQLDTIRTWWNNTHQGHGVGVATGPKSDIWVLDIDVKNGKDGFKSLQALTDIYGPLPPTATTQSGSGKGWHIYFQWDPDRPVSNGDNYNLGPGLDVRGDGGYVVIPPSIHDKTGLPYMWFENESPWEHHIADAPDWLYDIMHAERAPHTDPPAVTATHDANDLNQWVAQQHDYLTLLEADGWTLHHTDGDDTYLTRPGKNRRDGHSAVLHGTTGPLVVFTTELPNNLPTHIGTPNSDRSGTSYSLYKYVSATRHGGDIKALGRQYRQHTDELERAVFDNIPTTPDNNVVDMRDHSGKVAAPTPTTNPETGEYLGARYRNDFLEYWDGTHKPKTADTLTRTDGQSLLYLDQLNWIHGDSGSGKTWILLLAITQLLKQGVNVTWIHYEDPTPITIAQRLKLLGVTRQQAADHFHYYDPAGDPLNPQHIINHAELHNVQFVALDSIGEALNASGINENEDAEVGPWITNGPRSIVNAGIGFCGVDHGTKANDNPLHPSGSKRKRAALTGTGLLIEPIIAPTQTSDGQMRITIGKDRHGNHPQGDIAGIAHLRHRHDPTNLGIDLTIDPPDHNITAPQISADDQRKTDIVAAVEASPGLAKRELMKLVPGKTTEKSIAVDNCILEGRIKAEHGARNSLILWPISHVEDF